MHLHTKGNLLIGIHKLYKLVTLPTFLNMFIKSQKDCSTDPYQCRCPRLTPTLVITFNLLIF